MTEAQLRFACEQLRKWGGLPEAKIRRIYKAETKRPAGEREGQGDKEAQNGRRKPCNSARSAKPKRGSLTVCASGPTAMR